MKLGYLTTPLAYLYSQNKKRIYEEVLKKSEQLADTRASLQSYIDEYEIQKSILDDIRLGVPQDGAELAAPIPGLQIAYTLQVGKLGGKNMSALIILKLKNGSDKTMRLTAFQFMDLITTTKIKFVGYNPFYTTQSVQNQIELKPGEGCELKVGSWEAMPLLSKDNLKTFRNWLAATGSKHFYTSLKENTLFQKTIKCGTFGVNYIYQLPSGEWVMSQAHFKDVYGNIEYMGITWMPVPLGLGKIILIRLLALFTFNVSDIIIGDIEDTRNKKKHGY